MRWPSRVEQRTAGKGAWGTRPHHCPELGAHLWAAWQCSLRVPRVCRVSWPGKSVWTQRAEKGRVWVPCPRAETEGSNTPTSGIKVDMMSSMAPYGKASVFSGGPSDPGKRTPTAVVPAQGCSLTAKGDSGNCLLATVGAGTGHRAGQERAGGTRAGPPQGVACCAPQTLPHPLVLRVCMFDPCSLPPTRTHMPSLHFWFGCEQWGGGRQCKPMVGVK